MALLDNTFWENKLWPYWKTLSGITIKISWNCPFKVCLSATYSRVHSCEIFQVVSFFETFLFSLEKLKAVTGTIDDSLLCCYFCLLLNCRRQPRPRIWFIPGVLKKIVTIPYSDIGPSWLYKYFIPILGPADYINILFRCFWGKIVRPAGELNIRKCRFFVKYFYFLLLQLKEA